MKREKYLKRLFSMVLCISIVFVMCFSLSSPTSAGTAATITVNCTSNTVTVNTLTWGVGAPDKYTNWPGNSTLQQRISDAKIKLVRVGPIQWGTYNNQDIYPSHNNWNWATLDTILNTIWNAGAQPVFVICGFPGGVNNTKNGSGVITSADWVEYGNCMAGIVQRYNVDKVLGAGKAIKYFEMWNEPTIEGDGKFSSQAAYGVFVNTVGDAMKAKDSSIKLIGPADAWNDLDSTSGWCSYAAKNLESKIDILCWHNYGQWADSGASDAARMAWTPPNYYSDVVKVKNGGTNGVLTGPSGKKYGAAITEYNVAQGDYAAFNAKYHNEFNATWLGSALINALKSKIDIFTCYNLAEAGVNHLGLLSNSSYAPYKPYYTYYLFGNYTGNQELSASGGATNLEYYATKNTSDGKYYLTVVNKDTSGVTYDVNINLSNISSPTGTVYIRKVNSTTNPTTSTSMSYAGSTFTYSVAPYNVVNFEIVPGTASTTLFQTGFESGDVAPTWLDTVDWSSNVGAYTGASKPECSPRQEVPHAGIATMMYSGKDNSTTASYCYFKVFDVNIPISSATKMSYWIYPQQDNARYVAIDYVCTDGSTLRDSGATDYSGKSMHANAGHGGSIAINSWTQIKCNVGQWLNGKTIDKILIAYDRPANTGDFRGYIDDVVITNGTLQ